MPARHALGSVLAAFIYRLSGGSNAVVGYVEAASGMTTLILGLPLGMYSTCVNVLYTSPVEGGGASVSLASPAAICVGLCK